MTEYFLDTNICIYALKGHGPGILRQMERLPPAAIRIPAIVKAELLYGAMRSRQRPRSLAAVRRFLRPFRIASFGSKAAAEYGRLRASLEACGVGVGPSDLLIASIVLANQGTLVTHDTRGFGRIEGLQIEDWASNP